jgi:hypothetical protein
MDRLHSLPSIRSFESEDDEERAPPRIADAFGEGVVPDHVADLQVFVVDHVVLFDQCASFLVVGVAPLPGNVLLRFGQHDDCFASAMTPLLAPRHAPRTAP